MQILVLNGSPRPHGNTAAMVEAFRKGAEENGHVVTVVNVCGKRPCCHRGECLPEEDRRVSCL